MVTGKISQKYHSHISDASNYSFIKFYVRIRSPNGNNIRDCLLFNYAFIISDVTQSIIFHCSAKPPEKNHHFRFFLGKLSKSRSLKLNISRTAWWILMILVSFCKILDGLSDEIILFRPCSSPVKHLSQFRVPVHSALLTLTVCNFLTGKLKCFMVMT